MLQHVNKVLIGTEAPAAYTEVDALTEGQVALFDQERQLITSSDEAAEADMLFIGLCTGTETVYDVDGNATEKAIIDYSMPIQKGSHPHYVFNEYVESAEDVIVITATDVTPVIGYRYVLRLVYNDIYEHPGQFTHTYEAIAKSTSAADLIETLANKINKHKGARVVATYEDAVLTLTAKEIPYNAGVTLDAGYSQVSVEAFMWYTIPTGILSNVMYPVENLTIAKTNGTPGKGNPYIIRDRENAAFGYRGITHRANLIYPYIAPEFRSDLDSTYDELVVEWDNKYLSNDNQYIKTTPLACEVYVTAGQLSGSTFLTALESFLAEA